MVTPKPTTLYGTNTRKAFLSSYHYAQTFLWIHDKRGVERPLLFNRPQNVVRQRKRAAILSGCRPRFLIVKSRRVGVTTQEQSDSYALCATQKGQNAVTLADTRDKTKRIFRMVNHFYDRSPPQIRPQKQRVNRQELDFSVLGSSFTIGTAGARTFGRGDTLQRVHGSEVAYWMDGRDQDVVENLIVGLTEAASHGEVVLESTANGQRGWFFHAVQDALRGEGEFTLIFVPWMIDQDCWERLRSDDERYEIMGDLSDREKWLVEEHGCVAEQIKWRRQKSNEKAMRDGRFLQEYPETVEEAFIATSSMYFDAPMLNTIAQHIGDPIETLPNGTAIYEQPQEGARYVMGMDPAEGTPEGDNSALSVINVETGVQAARWFGKRGPEPFSKLAVEVAVLFNHALIGCERENHGHLCLHVLSNELHYPRLYRERIVNERRQASMKAGWSTNQLSRPIMLDDMREAMLDGSFGTRDRAFLSECRTFEISNTGKPEARSGFHDDVVMCNAIAWQVRKRGIHEVKVSIL